MFISERYCRHRLERDMKRAISSTSSTAIALDRPLFMTLIDSWNSSKPAYMTIYAVFFHSLLRLKCPLKMHTTAKA